MYGSGRLPDNVSFVEGAAATDAGMTSYHALYVAGGAKPGMKIGIIAASSAVMILSLTDDVT